MFNRYRREGGLPKYIIRRAVILLRYKGILSPWLPRPTKPRFDNHPARLQSVLRPKIHRHVGHLSVIVRRRHVRLFLQRRRDDGRRHYLHFQLVELGFQTQPGILAQITSLLASFASASMHPGLQMVISQRTTYRLYNREAYART